ncbi:MAG: hypothetical protein QM673_16730 [Gordonia sp. (in: high G+C Gram-positive bacteria)]
MTVVAATAFTGCGFTIDTHPSSIVLPPTDALSTESTIPTTSVADSTAAYGDSTLPSWTIGRLIGMAPRAANSRYHRGSVSARSSVEDTSGFHFSTPDHSVNCSTEIDDQPTLACRANNGQLRTRSQPGSRPSCTWTGEIILLTASGPQRGGCSNEHPVRYNSVAVDYGETISIGHFSCLVQTVGTFCLESHSQIGFSLTSTGYAPINAWDRAPATLLGPSTENRVPTLGTGATVPDNDQTGAPPS